MRARAAARLTCAMLAHNPRRLLLSIAGVAFAALLMLTQLGFRNALLDGAVAPFRALDADLVMAHRDRASLYEGRPIPRVRLAQARAVPGVARAAPLYMAYLPWRSRVDGALRNIRVFGIEPRELGFLEARALLPLLARADTVVLDQRSLSYHGPIAVGTTELGRRRVEIVGLFTLGTSTECDGNVLTGAETFARLRRVDEPDDGAGRALDDIDFALLKVDAGRDPEAIARALARELPDDVAVYTKEAAVAREAAYLEANAPLTAMFGLGMVLAFVVGLVICYQILYTDVMDHAAELATLKAMGYGRDDLFLLVALEACFLGLAGFAPSALASIPIYDLLGRATGYLFLLTAPRILATLAFLLVMCLLSAALAAVRIARLDPAEVF
jgi:putative ABC transport system permease protein